MSLAVALDDTHAYWSSFDAIGRTPKTGGGAEILYQKDYGVEGTCLAVDDQAVYWVASGSNVIMRLAK